MKTFSYKQALDVLDTYFCGYKIINKWDTLRELCIVFADAAGKQWVLFSSGDAYFQNVEDFIIYEA